jgi:DNA-binding HxlR family transcriptional regulator
MMIKNLELTRQILLQAERSSRVDARDPKISYHILALRREGLVDAAVVRRPGDFHNGMVATSLTRKGRSLLEVVKDDWAWEHTKDAFTQPGIFFSLSNILDFLKRSAERHNHDAAA